MRLRKYPSIISELENRRKYERRFSMSLTVDLRSNPSVYFRLKHERLGLNSIYVYISLAIDLRNHLLFIVDQASLRDLKFILCPCSL